MSKTSNDASRFSFLLCTALATPMVWASAQSPAVALEPQVRIHARVYDYVGVPPRVLAKAEEQAGMIFLQASDVTWENLTPPKDPSQGKPVGPHPANAAGVDLRIVSRFESITQVRYDSMGFAVPPDTATLSLQWVEKLVSLGIAEGGAAMAHEIGHLFLGPNSHSPAGIMRADWKEEDLLKVSQARFTFTPDQAQRIRTQVRYRQEQQGTASTFTLAR